MVEFDTTKNLKQYLALYKIKKQQDMLKEKYTHKNYDKRMTSRDKKIAESKFTYRAKNMPTEKHFYLLIIMFIVLMIFIDSSMGNTSNFMVISYIFLFMLLMIAFFYRPTKKFYWIFLILFIVVFLLTKRFNFINIADLQGSKNNLKLNNKK
tara:strand:+ start:209 stop:664 length:456 start_codon:yes stop_codon:yes gene_type:complete